MATKGQTLWINNLTGGINHKSPSLMKENEHELLVNITQSQLGTISHRLGIDLLYQVDSDEAIRGLHQYDKDDSTYYLHSVASGDLFVDGALQESSVWAETSEIDMVNFIGRHYMASSTADEHIRYATESGSTTYLKIFSTTASSSSTASTLVSDTEVFNEGMIGMTVFNTTDGTSRTITAVASSTSATVDSAINNDWDSDEIEMRLDGKYLAVNGPYMMVAGNSVYPRRVYYTDVESEDINVGTDFFRTAEMPTGLTSFGNGRPFAIFSNSKYLVVDPATIYTDEVSDFGSVSHRSIQVVRGSIIFLDRKGIFMLSANSSFPVDISEPLKNDYLIDGIFNLIDTDNLSVIASGSVDNRYYLALRDLTGTVFGQTLDSCLLVYDMDLNSWRMDTATNNDIGNVFSTFTSSNDTFLYSGSYTDGSVYKLETPGVYVDDDNAGSTNTITSLIQTKHFVFFDKNSGAINMRNVMKFHFRYYAASAMTVKYTIDGGSTYTQVGTTATLPAHTSSRWTYAEMDIGVECKTLSLQITCSGRFELYGVGFEVDSRGTTGLRVL